MLYEEILKYFPQTMKQVLSNENMNELEEIRVRNNLPLILKAGQAEKILDYVTNTEDINFIFQKICENSVYSYQKQIASGYITIKGGCLLMGQPPFGLVIMLWDYLCAAPMMSLRRVMPRRCISHGRSSMMFLQA